MDTIKHYVNLNRLTEDLTQIYKDVRDDFASGKDCDFILDEYDDDWIDEYAFEVAVELNNDMKRYLNETDHGICGNFNNIDYDYPQQSIATTSVQAMIDRLNDGDVSRQAEEDRDWLLDWFWKTFGSFAIEYNFKSFLSDAIYQYEQEN